MVPEPSRAEEAVMGVARAEEAGGSEERWPRSIGRRPPPSAAGGSVNGAARGA